MGFEWITHKNYKRHYLCLKCQKGFKRASKDDMKNPVSLDLSNLMNDYYSTDSQRDIMKFIDASHQKLNVVCPNCTNPMLQVHYDFEVPPQRDTKSWKNLQKDLPEKNKIQYETYIHWHQLELKKASKNSSYFKRLTRNLGKLKKA